jgi:hypothetical protein
VGGKFKMHLVSTRTNNHQPKGINMQIHLKVRSLSSTHGMGNDEVIATTLDDAEGAPIPFSTCSYQAINEPVYIVVLKESTDAELLRYAKRFNVEHAALISFRDRHATESAQQLMLHPLDIQRSKGNRKLQMLN